MKPIEIHIEGYKITIAEDDNKENKITVDKFTVPTIPVQDHKIEAKPYKPIVDDDWYRTPPSWYQNPPMWWEKPYCTWSDNDPNVVKGTTTAESVCITTNPPIYNVTSNSTGEGIVSRTMKGKIDDAAGSD